MAKVNIQVFINNVTLAGLSTIRSKVQSFLDAESNSQLTRFTYTEEKTMAKVNVQISVANVTLAGLNSIRSKIQNYLDSESSAVLTLFLYAEE